MRKSTTLAIAICGVVTVLSRVAAAEKVALIRPHDEAGVLLDAFNRLQAELSIHHFEPAVVEVDVGTAPVERLAHGLVPPPTFPRRTTTPSRPGQTPVTPQVPPSAAQQRSFDRGQSANPERPSDRGR